MKFYSIHKKYFSVISKKQFDFFKENGYVKLEQVFTPQKIENLREEMMKIISNVDRKEIKDKFKADMNFMSNYFLESGDKIRFRR